MAYKALIDSKIERKTLVSACAFAQCLDGWLSQYTARAKQSGDNDNQCSAEYTRERHTVVKLIFKLEYGYGQQPGQRGCRKASQ